MIICNTHGDEVVQINKSLVENNYALLNDDWLEQKIKKVNFKLIIKQTIKYYLKLFERFLIITE